MLNRDIYPPQRYSVNSTGGCSLTITQLVVNDSGRFMCKHSLTDGEEKTRSSILIVISVTESCLSNVTSNALDKGDGYSLRCVINIPAKSVEPSNVALSFHNKIVGEAETTDEKQWLTVNTTLTGIAKKENITQRLCRASFPPNTQADYDKTTVTLDVCTTQWIVSYYPVENIAVSPPSGPYYKGNTVRCTANGHPSPTFKWTHLNSGAVVDGDTLEIKGDAGDKYTCIAMNTVKGKETAQSITIEVSAKPNPVENIAVSSCGPYYKGNTVRCTADGYPPPTFKWTHGKSRTVVDGDTLVIKGDVGDKYTCTATNTFKGREAHQRITFEVSPFPPPPPPPPPSPSHPPPGALSDGVKIGIGVAIGVGGMLVLGGILFAVLCMRYEWIKRTKTDDKRTHGMEEDSERSRSIKGHSNIPHFSVLSAQKSNVEPTQLTTPTKVDVIEQSLSDRATDEDLGRKLNVTESSL